MIAILLLFGASLAFIISRIVSKALLEESKSRGASTAMHLAARITEPLLAMDFVRMKGMVDEAARSSEDTVFIFILEKRGKPLVHTFTGGFPVDLVKANDSPSDIPFHVQLITDGMELFYDFAAPVTVGKERLGTVRYGMSHHRISSAVDRLLWITFLAIAVATSIATIIGTMLARSVAKRVQTLRSSAEEIVKGNLDIQALPEPGQQCWESIQCDNKDCPAFGERRYRCWYIPGTLCPTCIQGDFEKKVENCKKCPVYRKNAGDEIQDLAEYFDVMAMTLKKRMEDLKVLQERIIQSQKLESLGQLAAGVAHELNTPLGIILGYTQLMLEDAQEGSENHESLLVLEKHCRICKKIVADLLRFSRTTASDKKPLIMSDLLEQVLAVVEHTLALDRISIDRDFDPDAPPVFGDPEKLQQVFLNLLNNAHDAIGSDGKVTVSVSHDHLKSEVVVSVADTGQGIPDEIKDKIFDPFFTTKGVGKGTGLGLSVTFGIVKDHGAHIELESATSEAGAEVVDKESERRKSGTTFKLHFPAYKQ